MKRCGKMLFAVLVVALLMTALLLPAFAATGAENSGGDLLLFDNELTVSDAVGGDLLVFATALEVKGEVHGSIRACTSQMLLDSKVDRNVTVAGLEIVCDEHFEANDVKIAGNQVVFLGSCDTLSVYGGTVYIGGTVRGNVYCEADQVILLKSADFSSAEIASSSEPLVAKTLSDTSYSSLGGSKFEKAVKFTKTQSAFVSDLIDLPIALLAAVVLALVMTLVFKRMTGRIPQQLRAHPFSFCLKGLGAIMAIPFAAVFLLIPVVTWPVSLSILLLYVVMMLLADAIAAVVLSRALMPYRNPYLSASLFAAIITVLSILPFVGWLVSLFSATVGFGAVVSLLLKRKDPMESMSPEMDFSL